MVSMVIGVHRELIDQRSMRPAQATDHFGVGVDDS
jgi:hypothetical protein